MDRRIPFCTAFRGGPWSVRGICDLRDTFLLHGVELSPAGEHRPGRRSVGMAASFDELCSLAGRHLVPTRREMCRQRSRDLRHIRRRYSGSGGSVAWCFLRDHCRSASQSMRRATIRSKSVASRTDDIRVARRPVPSVVVVGRSAISRIAPYAGCGSAQAGPGHPISGSCRRSAISRARTAPCPIDLDQMSRSSRMATWPVGDSPLAKSCSPLASISGPNSASSSIRKPRCS